MAIGQRLPNSYLLKINKWKIKRCPNCGKGLRRNNKLGLCFMCGERERTMNHNNQGTYK